MSTCFCCFPLTGVDVLFCVFIITGVFSLLLLLLLLLFLGGGVGVGVGGDIVVVVCGSVVLAEYRLVVLL